MLAVEKRGKFRHYVFVFEECVGGGRAYYIDLIVGMQERQHRWKLPIVRDNWEAASIAKILRHAAEEIEKIIA
jgi:hypothetical protein